MTPSTLQRAFLASCLSAAAFFLPASQASEVTDTAPVVPAASAQTEKIKFDALVSKYQKLVEECRAKRHGIETVQPAQAVLSKCDTKTQ